VAKLITQVMTGIVEQFEESERKPFLGGDRDAVTA